MFTASLCVRACVCVCIHVQYTLVCNTVHSVLEGRHHEELEECIIKLIIYVSTAFYLYIRLRVSTYQLVIFRLTKQTKSFVLCAHWDSNIFALIKYIKSGKFLC